MSTTTVTSQDIPTPTLGAHGEPCPVCAAPLAADQRYCLNCGRRRAPARVPYADLLAGRAPDEVLPPMASPPPSPPAPARRGLPSPALVAGAATASAFVLAVGVLIGAAAGGSDQPHAITAAAPVQKPPVINVNAGGAAPAAAELASDWPDGEEGWTVELSSLPKEGSAVADVTQAKSDAQGKGATDVGALDSDDWSSLDPGEYVVYSGVFTGKGAKAKARAAAKKLKADFPGAKAVQVSAGDVPGAEGTTPDEKPQKADPQALQDLQKATGEDQQKKSAKLPPTLELGGKAPPKDDKPAGGGSDAEVIQ